MVIGAPGRNRTCGTWIRNPMLYPLSYGGMMGFNRGFGDLYMIIKRLARKFPIPVSGLVI